jgi:broad specificity phosphatase PhoE
MPALVLVRHSIPAIDPVLPSTEWGLSPAGERAAVELADALGAFSAMAVATSPERKARETAAIIAGRRGIPMNLEKGLREHDRSSVGYLPRSDFEAGIRRLLRAPDQLVFGDETADALFLRFSSSLERARATAPQHDVIAVSHGAAISIYVGRTLGVEPAEFWRALTMPMAVILSDQRMEVVAPPSARAR